MGEAIVPKLSLFSSGQDSSLFLAHVFLLALVIDGKALNITFVSWVEVSELVQRRDTNTIVDAIFTNLAFESIDVFFFIVHSK